MSQLKKETEQCAVYHVQPTKVAKSYKLSTGKCTLLRHLTLLRPGQMSSPRCQSPSAAPHASLSNLSWLRSQCHSPACPWQAPQRTLVCRNHLLLHHAATTPLRPRSGQLRQILLRRSATVPPQHAPTANKNEKRQTEIRTALNIGKQNLFYIQNIKYAQIPICCVKMIKIFIF